VRDATFALAWCTAWKADVDGRQTLGQCKRASDLDRELAEYDFVILLQKAFWQDISVTDLQRAALLDHELCHAAVAHDKRGEPIEDERGRKVYRLRKHDLEEFAEIAARYGTWKRDLELFAVALRRSPQQALPITEASAPVTQHTH
jgi:Putative phage metallopeptidase